VCGIVGAVDWTGRPVTRALITQMCAVLRHRGPDEEGVYVSPPGASVNAGLGVRRLSIIDVAGGQQPVCNEDGRVSVVQNGEIYNFTELRAALEAKGHQFRSRSDTEVIVHAYEEYGEDCVDHLHGMFAFAVWDEPRRRLLLARDRLGKKPLVYAERDGRLTFASELGALLIDDGIAQDLDLDALDAYLTYLAVPAPFTIYRGARKLPPGHVLVYEDGRMRVRRYWDLAFTPKFTGTEAEASERLVALLEDAVRRRLVAEVPLGALLSGGVDSSVITSLMARLIDRPVKTFSIGFDEPEYNELPAARVAARAFACEHHEFVVKPQAAEVLPKLLAHFGEPFADSSAVPTYYLAQLTREHVTVALSGDGGDELFAGYGRHLANGMAQRARRMPRPLLAAAAGLARVAVPASAPAHSFPARAQRFLLATDLAPAARYEQWVGHFTGEPRARLYADGFGRRGDLIAPLFSAHAGLDGVDSILAVDTAFYLPTDLLVKMDIMSMANSLEVRSPFLDHRVVEFAARLPSRFKLSGTTHKYLVKRAFAGVVPSANLTGVKRGFAVPIGQWFRAGLRDFLLDHLRSRAFTERGIFDATAVDALVSEHLDRRADHTHRLWILLVLAVWFGMARTGR
jgi:asparagine synthase (glutamine-hydrolysing)